MTVIDMHAHTKFSDGTTTPSEVVHTYHRAGVRLMSLTDHDTMDALEEGSKKAAELGIDFVNGVEISTRDHDHLHFLGYKVNPNSPKLQSFLAQNRANRNERIKKIISLLAASGVDINEEDVFKLVKTVASRAHVADALKNKGIAPSRQEAFRKFLVPGRAGYVPSMGFSVLEAIAVIKEAGGYAFIAHPGLVQEHWNFPQWVNAGLDGIEVYYPSHSFQMRTDLLSIAKKYNLMPSGGSDHHGAKSGRDNKAGMDVPDEVYQNLKAKLCS